MAAMTTQERRAFARALGRRISDARLRRGLSQSQLAGELDVEQTAISKWELGQKIPTVISLRSVARALGVTSDDLIPPDFGDAYDRLADHRTRR